MLLIRDKTIENLTSTANAVLETLFQWGCGCKLRFNLSKTTAMLVTRKHKVDDPTLVMNGELIKTVDNIIYYI